MNKINVILGVLLSHSLLLPSLCFSMQTDTHTNIIQLPREKPNWKGLAQTSSATIIPGTAIGALDGLICYNVEKHFQVGFFGKLFLWTIGCIARSSVVTKTSDIMQSHHIPHHPALMHTTACIADWITYLLLKNRA